MSGNIICLLWGGPAFLACIIRYESIFVQFGFGVWQSHHQVSEKYRELVSQEA
ncbi:hypothetical protein HY3_01270 [Hyphomonas pacifica]|uniref:Uncharacterized protein n=1 Tax=Hyphomonas pacifica TaxID=1280941 RepID=A0A062U613_9PROT|nr:hypothetical protein HY2_01185 [Hyphomonas pacifica]RAN32627.1 hypothetical protein HY11_17550 [Hyphomonas pacifica]RAN34264.1 hypothetical protein HY3_01270 [Hyphomonas pacifica]